MRSFERSAVGQSRHSDCVPITSDLPRKADKFEAGGHFGKVPQPDSCTAAYSDYFDHFVGADFLEQRFNAHRFMGSDDQV
jgi:hypothetical protein